MQQLGWFGGRLGVIQSHLQTHSRSLAIMLFDSPYDFLFVFHCNYVSILHRFQDIIPYFRKFKDVT